MFNTNTMDPARLPAVLNAKQVAALWGVTPRLVQKMASCGQIPAHRVGVKLWRFNKKEILEVVGIEDR